MEPYFWLEPVFDDRRDAMFFLELANEYVRTHGLITIKQVYEYACFGIWDEGRLWGWTDISKAYIERTYEGFVVRFPNPKKFHEIKIRKTK